MDKSDHHAILVTAESISSAQISPSLKRQDADIQHFVFDRMGIDDARLLSVTATRKPVVHDVRVLVIYTNEVTTEAQNALLKLFEEPPLTTRFVVVMAAPDKLLPTLLSRFYRQEVEVVKADTEVFDSFQKSSYADRMLEITARTKNKDSSWINAIFLGSEYFADSCKDTKIKESILRSVLFVRQYSGVRGSSSKMLLEELAISLP